MSGQLLTARQTAERLGVCTETVLVWIRHGKLPAIRLPSGQIRVSEAQLDAQLEEWATTGRGGVTQPRWPPPNATLQVSPNPEDEEQ